MVIPCFLLPQLSTAPRCRRFRDDGRGDKDSVLVQSGTRSRPPASPNPKRAPWILRTPFDQSRRLEEILRAGGQRGICEFRADVLAYNGGMLRLLARHTDVTRRRTQRGIAEISFRRRSPVLRRNPRPTR